MNCKVIQDLLPIYNDELTSQETNILIEDHLKSCSNCNEIFVKISKNLDLEESIIEEDFAEVKQKKLIMSLKNRLTMLISGTFIIAIVIGLLSDVYIFSFLAFFLLITSIIIFFSSFNKDSKKYWLVGLCIYFFSALAGFSIGIYTVSITFIFFALAVKQSITIFRVSKYSSLISILIGLLCWFGIYIINGLNWIFYPVIVLIELLF